MKLSSEVFAVVSKAKFEKIVESDMDVETLVKYDPKLLEPENSRFLVQKEKNFLSMSEINDTDD